MWKVHQLLGLPLTQAISAFDTDGEHVILGTSLGTVLLYSEQNGWTPLQRRAEEIITVVSVHKTRIFAFVGDLYVCLWDWDPEASQVKGITRKIDIRPNHGLDFCSRSVYLSHGTHAHLLTKGTNLVFSLDSVLEKITRSQLTDDISRSSLPCAFDGKYFLVYEEPKKRSGWNRSGTSSRNNAQITVLGLQPNDPRFAVRIPESSCHHLHMEDNAVVYSLRDRNAVECISLTKQQVEYTVPLPSAVVSLTMCGNLVVVLLTDASLCLVGNGVVISRKMLSPSVLHASDLYLTRLAWFPGLSHERLLLSTGYALFEIKNWKE